MSKFTVGGVSNNNGNIKVRFCSDLVLRIKNLSKQGDTDINLVQLPNEMTKVEVCNYLLSLPEFAKYKTDIEDVLGKKAATDPRLVIEKPVVDQEIEALKAIAG